MKKTNYHDPVLLESSVAALITDPDGVYVDATFGGGGHSKQILDQLSSQGRLYAFDQDQDAVKNCIDDDRFTLIEANFKDIKRYLRLYGVVELNGVLADFGVSSHQFDSSERGFSIRFNGPLDMRMNRQGALTAAEVINRYSIERLVALFKSYGELKGAYRIAEAIFTARAIQPIQTTEALIKVVKPLIPERFLNKTLAQLFQAIRIEVNQELEVIKYFLEEATKLLLKGGKFVCISYHSLEDRLVKRFFREGVFEGEALQDFYGNRNQPLKPEGRIQLPAEEEIHKNPRARSAKLRIAIKR